MSEQTNSIQSRPPAPSKSSRMIAMGAVALLIVIAIAGIVLATRHRPVAAVPEGAATGATSPGSTQRTAAAPTRVNPDEVNFASGSTKLPTTATETIAVFATKARASGKIVRLSARFLTGEDKVKDQQLAKDRAAAVRAALQADGVQPDKLQMELIEVPAGTLTAVQRNRIEMLLR
ncbi:MAG: OmpA family protein [Pseudomonadota bacterium]|nr:OmpA family protein [Pseudomonadota bacterium]